MPIVFGQLRWRARDVGREPLAVLERYEAVLPAVPHLHRNPDRFDLKSPGLDHRQAVVPPAVAALLEARVHPSDYPARDLLGLALRVSVRHERLHLLRHGLWSQRQDRLAILRHPRARRLLAL